MLIKDTGIVLAAERSGETSLTVRLLGRHSGKIRLLSKGAFGARHPGRGALEPGHEVEVVFYHRDGQMTHYLKESSLIARPAAGRDSLPHLAACLAALELLDEVCVPGASLDETIVDTAVRYLAAPAGDDPLFVFLAFAIQLLDALGVSPDTASCVRCGASPAGGTYSPRDGVSFCAEHRPALTEAVALTTPVVAAAAQCATASFDAIARERVPRDIRKELGRLVHWTYTHHVQGYHLPRSLDLI